MKHTAFVIAFLLGFLSLHTQTSSKFYTRWGGGGHDIGYGVIQTLNGQYAVTGSTSSFGNGNTDVYFAIVDSTGWLRYQTSFGGFNNDIGQSIIQLADSGFVIAGYTNSFGNGGYDVYVVRTDKTGALVWQKTIGGMDWDFGYSVKQSSDGGFVICGSTQSYGYGKTDGYIVKLDASGTFQWQKTYGGPEDDSFKSFVFTYNNYIAFAGTTKSRGDIKGDCWLVKTDMNGDSLFTVRYGDNKKQFLNDVVEETNGDFVLAGATDIYGNDSTFAYLLILDQNGIFKADNYFTRNEKYNDFQFSTISNGNYAGNYFYVYKTFDAPVNYKIEPLYMLFNGIWPYSFSTCGTFEDDEIYDSFKTKDKGYVCIGYTKGLGAELTDFYLVKLDSTIASPASVVGINEPKNESISKLKVYPTVSRDFINVEVADKTKSTVLLFNSSGQLISQLTFSEKTRLNIENLTSGIYFLSIRSDSSAKSFKIVKAE